MITDINSLDIHKIYSYTDYLSWQFKERLELIKGRVFKMSPTPATQHQIISGNISGELYMYLKTRPCKVFSAPFDVRFSSLNEGKNVDTVVQPDICVICDMDKIDEKGCQGAPDIIVEVLSASTSKKDLKDKFYLYEENHVKEYWVVFPNECVIEVYGLNSKLKYFQRERYVLGDFLTTEILPDLEIRLNDIFKN